MFIYILIMQHFVFVYDIKSRLKIKYVAVMQQNVNILK